MSTELAVPRTVPSQASAKPFLVVWCLCLIALELYGAVYLRLATGHGQIDFQAIYVGEYLARTSPAHLYDVPRQVELERTLEANPYLMPYYHPSYEAFLLSPLSLPGFRAAYSVSIAFNMLVLLLAFFAARAEFSATIPVLQPRPGLMFFVFVPVLYAVLLGQDSTLSLLLYCLTWRQLKAGKDRSAGFFLALALFKFQIALPIAALIAIRKGWRFLQGFALTGMGVAALSIGIVGMAGTKAYLNLLLPAGAAPRLVAQIDRGYQLSMPNLAGLLYACGGWLLHSRLVFDGLCGLVSLALFVWCARVIRRTELDVAFSIAVVCGLLVSYHLYIYDVTLVLLPVVLIGNRIRRYTLLSLFGVQLVTLVGAPGLTPYFVVTVPILLILVPILLSESRRADSSPVIAAGA